MQRGIKSRPLVRSGAWVAGGLAALGLLPGNRASGQELLLPIHGAAQDPLDGMVGVGDIDGDGTPDLVTFGYAVPVGQPGLHARSGRDAAILWQVDGVVSYGLSVIGDLDGDGVVDFVSGEPLDDTAGTDAGATFVRSGRDGTVLRATYGAVAGENFGAGCAPAQDIDGDGVPDYLAHRSEPNGKGEHVIACAGADGSVLLDLSANPGWGSSYAGLGDVDGDGWGDLAVGDPSKSTRQFQSCGRVHVYSGRDGVLLYRVDGASDFATFGRSLACLHDVNGDGVRDLLVGAPVEGHNGDDAVGTIYVLSGVDGQILRSTAGELEYDLFGMQVAALGDVSGDGVPDYGAIADGATYGGDYSGSAYVFSGATGTRLLRFDGLDVWDDLSILGDAGGDADGDGIGDLLLRYRDADPATGFGDGRIELRGGNDLWIEARPHTAAAGENALIVTLEGIPGNPTVTAIVAIDGVPTFQILDGVGHFKPTGARHITGVVPPGISGTTLELRSWALGAAGVIDSGVATFTGE